MVKSKTGDLEVLRFWETLYETGNLRYMSARHPWVCLD